MNGPEGYSGHPGAEGTLDMGWWTNCSMGSQKYVPVTTAARPSTRPPLADGSLAVEDS
ncbi:hypothetical protein [Spongiactinospora rosea]|uniref:hypothetical protein n=1 Tax=Spongiactinospora rosea TaxID=2248750 RepID=UPI0013142C30|nr:hypothetical protein [Spongiactinospora rosea]